MSDIELTTIDPVMIALAAFAAAGRENDNPTVPQELPVMPPDRDVPTTPDEIVPPRSEAGNVIDLVDWIRAHPDRRDTAF